MNTSLLKETRSKIIQALGIIPTNTIWGIGISLFLDNISEKTDQEILNLIRDLQSQIFDGPNNMKIVLGASFDFFKYYQLPLETTHLVAPLEPHSTTIQYFKQWIGKFLEKKCVVTEQVALDVANEIMIFGKQLNIITKI